MSNPLVFGKDSRSNIVSIELDNEWVEVFTEKNGIVANEWFPANYWILSNKPHSGDWKRLDGSQHYSWIKEYTEFNNYIQDRNWLKKKQADVYYLSDLKESYMVRNGLTYFKNNKVNDISILGFDIETNGLTHDKDSKVLLISNTFINKGKLTHKLFCYDEYESPIAMLNAWCEWVREVNPSVILGHNIFGFDIPYLDFIAHREDGELCLGRDGSPLRFDNWESKFRIDGSKDLHYKRSHIYGRNIIDTLFLSYKYDIGRNYDNYKLKYIVAKEGLEKKDRVFYDGSKIRDTYKDPIEWKKIKEYCIHDADDAVALYQLMVPAYFYLTPSIPKTFQQMLYTASGSQLNSFLVRSYLQENHSIPKASDVTHFEGAISFAVPNLYKNLYKLDIKSMYPSIMLQYKIHDKWKDPKQNFYKMVEYFTKERFANKKLAKETKDKYYTDLEQAQKIVINSAYGLLGAPGLHYNSGYNAALVTRHGRDILKQTIKWATSKDYDYWMNLFKEKTS